VVASRALGGSFEVKLWQDEFADSSPPRKDKPCLDMASVRVSDLLDLKGLRVFISIHVSPGHQERFPNKT